MRSLPPTRQATRVDNATLFRIGFCLSKAQVPYAGGGKGRPRPLHPRPGTSSLGTPIRCIRYAERLARMLTG